MEQEILDLEIKIGLKLNLLNSVKNLLQKSLIVYIGEKVPLLRNKTLSYDMVLCKIKVLSLFSNAKKAPNMFRCNTEIYKNFFIK